MKALEILWLTPLVVIGLVCWLAHTSSPTPQARIRVENDVSDINIAGRGSTAAQLTYDPYFIPVNNFTKILIPGHEQK